MKTGLKKKQKSTVIYFDEDSDIIDVNTHNATLKKRLRKYSEQYPQSCCLLDTDEFGQCQFVIKKGRLSFRLTAPYTDERREASSNRAKENNNSENFHRTKV